MAQTTLTFHHTVAVNIFDPLCLHMYLLQHFQMNLFFLKASRN